MSIRAKNAKSFRKKDVKESKSLSNGFTKLVFAHKASAGETGIDLGSLVVPTEMSALGFTNPTPSRLLEARMFQFKDNLEVQSSAKGQLMQSLAYTIGSNSRINFQGFAADEGEIFIGVLDSNPISGIQVVDAKTPVSPGDLADGITDFPIGFSTSAIKEELLVTRNGLVQKRNTNNSSTVLDGNYFVVDSGSGFGNVIRFNVAPSGSDDSILALAIGGIIESPTNSTWDEIEKVQGQIDAMIPDLAQALGNPETDYQAAPNSVDLKQFGDRVVDVDTRLAALEAVYSTTPLTFHGKRVAAQSTTHTLPETIDFDTIVIDSNSSHNSGTDEINITEDGFYSLGMLAVIATSAGNYERISDIRVNGSVIIDNSGGDGTLSDKRDGQPLVVETLLSAGDKVIFTHRQFSGVAKDMQAEAWVYQLRKV